MNCGESLLLILNILIAKHLRFRRYTFTEEYRKTRCIITVGYSKNSFVQSIYLFVKGSTTKHPNQRTVMIQRLKECFNKKFSFRIHPPPRQRKTDCKYSCYPGSRTKSSDFQLFKNESFRSVLKIFKIPSSIIYASLTPYQSPSKEIIGLLFF